MTGAEIVIRCLQEEGVEHVFGYPGGAVLFIYDELFKHEQTKTMQIFTWSEQPGVGRVPHPNVPGPLPFVVDEPRSKVPRIGEHTRTVMVDLGYKAEDIARMLDQAIVFEAKAA